MIISSSFRALQGQRVRLYLSILRSLLCFAFSRGVPCSFTSANLTASSGQSPESPSQPRTAPAGSQTELGRLDVIRETLSNKGFSKQAIDIICASWTAGTEKQYKGVWDKWSDWCHKRQIELLQASVIQVVEFLTDCYHEGKEYSTINTYRSVLSTTLCSMNDDRDSLGSHPLIARLLKGVYVLRPPTPRYSYTWDVSKVTDYLKTFVPLRELSLKSLTLKTVMLCALASEQRQQTLSALDLNFMKESRGSISFVVTDRLKTSRPGKPTEISFSSSDSASICPFAALKEYISRSETLRSRSPGVVNRTFENRTQSNSIELNPWIEFD